MECEEHKTVEYQTIDGVKYKVIKTTVTKVVTKYIKCVDRKTCIKCEQEQDIERFAVHKTSSDGHNSYCKTCATIVAKEWHRKKMEQKLKNKQKSQTTE